MKRIVLLVLALLMVGSLSYAEVVPKILVYEVNNATGAEVSTLIPTDAIKPGSKILGVGICKSDATLNWEGIVGLWDYVVDQGITYNEVVVEAEKSTADFGSEWFSYPIIVTTSIRVNQGANTRILIYYNR